MDRTYRRVEWAAVDANGDYVGPFRDKADAIEAIKDMRDGALARRHTITVITEWLVVNENDEEHVA